MLSLNVVIIDLPGVIPYLASKFSPENFKKL
jgi:hypothetical protein